MKERGFSLVELMVVVVIFSLVTGAAFEIYLTMSELNLTETAKVDEQFETAVELQLLTNDIRNLGFCVPAVCSVASKDNLTKHEAKKWEGFSKNEVTSKYSNIIGTDRLYISDMGEIVSDFSNDGTESGDLDDNAFTTITNIKIDYSGYYASLLEDPSIGDDHITVDVTDIDQDGNKTMNDHDYKATKSLIIAHPTGNPVEGKRIKGNHNKKEQLIYFKVGETLIHDFDIGDYVVPALCYHLKKPGSSSPFYDQPQVFTLARNSDPFLEGVEDFQVMYHYDGDSDGNWEADEWIHTLPTLGYSPNRLRSIKVTLMVRIPKRQSTEVDSRNSIQVIRNHRIINLNAEMRHYYRRIFTVDVVPRNIRMI